MKKSGFWKKLFIALGIIFTVIIVLIIGAIIALIIIKPYGLDITARLEHDNTTPYDHPLLSADQEKTLQNLGVDPANIPTSITADQIQCAVEALGQARANELLSGATPTAIEIYKLKNCL